MEELLRIITENFGYRPPNQRGPLTTAPPPGTAPIPGVPAPPPYPTEAPLAPLEAQAPPPPMMQSPNPWEFGRTGTDVLGPLQDVWSTLSAPPAMPARGVQAPVMGEPQPAQPVASSEGTGGPRPSVGDTLTEAVGPSFPAAQSAWDFIKQAWQTGPAGPKQPDYGGVDYSRMANDEARFRALNPEGAPIGPTPRPFGPTDQGFRIDEGQTPQAGQLLQAHSSPPGTHPGFWLPGGVGTPQPVPASSPKQGAATAPSRTGGSRGGSAAPTVPPPAASAAPVAAQPSRSGNGADGPRGKSALDQSFWRTLGVVGLAMMRPIAPGGNWLGHIGDALGAGLTYKLMDESAQDAGALKERQVAAQEQQAATSAARAGAQIRRSDELLPLDKASELARIRQIDAQIANMGEGRELRQLQAQRERLELALKQRYGDAQVRAALGEQAARTQAYAQRAETPEMKTINEAVKNNKTLDGRTNWRGAAATAAAGGIKFRHSPASIASGQKLLQQFQQRTGRGPGSAEYEEERERLNTELFSNRIMPGL